MSPRREDEPSPSPRTREALAKEQLLVVRAGHGANCSSIGSVIDTLFATATLGAALFAAVVAALAKEEVKIVGPQEPGPRNVEDHDT